MTTRKRKQPNTVTRPNKRKTSSSTTASPQPTYTHEFAAALQMKVGSKQVVQASTSLYKSMKTSKPLLFDLGKNNLIHAKMICRPSKHNRSPYVADILLEDGREAIAHVPCMDMGGKCVSGASLLLKIATDRKGNPIGSSALGKYGTPKCEFITQLLWNNELNYKTWVVAHPGLGEKIAESISACNLLGNTIEPIESYEREVRNICGSDMRTDFVLTHTNGTRSVMEIKTVVDTDLSKEDARLKLAQHRDHVRQMEYECKKDQEEAKNMVVDLTQEMEPIDLTKVVTKNKSVKKHPTFVQGYFHGVHVNKKDQMEKK